MKKIKLNEVLKQDSSRDWQVGDKGLSQDGEFIIVSDEHQELYVDKGLIKIKDNECADHNFVYPFKQRMLDPNKPVFVYRNLTKSGKWYSIKQKGIVVAHATAVCLKDCEFIVSEKGRSSVIKNKRKFPHAYIKGLYKTSGMGTAADRNDLPIVIKYNPYLNKKFIDEKNNRHVSSAMFVICNSEGVKAAYVTSDKI